MIHRLVPKEYKELLQYISPAAFQVVDWKKALGQFSQMSKHALDSEYISKLADYNLRYLPSNVEIAEKETMESNDASLTKEKTSEVIMDFYFSQFFSDQGSFIDLRSKHFICKTEHLYYRPGKFVHKFADDFRSGMLAVYEGYYLDRPKQLERGMLQLGLIKNTDQKTIEETKKLLFSHFGSADQGPVKLNLEDFRSSFHQLFLHFKSKKIRLSSDFLFLGIYLVTLYLAMEEFDEPIDVKDSFIQAWERNSKL